MMRVWRTFSEGLRGAEYAPKPRSQPQPRVKPAIRSGHGETGTQEPRDGTTQGKNAESDL